MSAASVLSQLRDRVVRDFNKTELDRDQSLETVRTGQIVSLTNYAVGGVRAVNVELNSGGTIQVLNPSNAQLAPGARTTVVTDNQGRSMAIGVMGNKY
jgi:hypothetical protein